MRERSSLDDDLKRVGDGDAAALERVYQQTASKLHALCVGITGNQEAARDVLQEVYIKVWNRAAGFDPGRAGALTWLCAIARNSAIDWKRARKAGIHVSDDILTIISDGSEAADDRIVRSEREKRAVNLLDQLDEDQRHHLRRAFFEDLSYSQLAQEEGIPLGTLKSRIRRGLKRIREQFDD